MSNECLPDPAEHDIPEPPTETALVKHLYETIQVKDKAMEEKLVAILALGDQVAQKDKVIREQAEHLDEYRMQTLHLRGGADVTSQQKPLLRRKCHKGSQHAEIVDSDMHEQEGKMDNCARTLTEEEDSWSEPGNTIFYSRHCI